MKKSDHKRANADKGGDEGITEASPSPLPPYGSQEYWDERYKRIKTDSNNNNNTDGSTSAQTAAAAEPDPFHSWYFNYEELSPLILPLILGEKSQDTEASKVGKDNDTSDKANTDNTDKDQNAQISVVWEEGKKSERIPTSNEENEESQGGVEDEEGSDNVDGTEVVEDEEEDSSIEDDDDDGNDDDDDDDDPPQRIGLANHGPIEILEVGCGDVPLGPDIIKSILELEQSETNLTAAKILKQVVCMDYSPTVIGAMNDKTKSEKQGRAPIPLLYECADARKMPYEDGRFQLILEKGTMDAMLSDVKAGSDNCRAIVGEMGRVLSVGGCIMVISHINAHTDNGMDWVNTIIIPGIRTSSAWNKWSIEVHGSDNTDTEEEDVSDGPGPAVYILHKKEETEQKDGDDADDYPTVSLRFFSY